MSSTVAKEKTFSVLNPATGELAGEAPESSQERLDAAFAAAEAALPAWSADENGRREAMHRLADALDQNSDELAEILVSESGKQTSLAAMENVGSAKWIRWFADVEEIPREVIQDNDAARVELWHKPLGVVAAITPWNFPIASAMCKLAGALRLGTTIVHKPSQFTPLSPMRLDEIINEALPPGVFNTVTGGNELGAAMTRHPVPRKVTMTGSIATGKKVMTAAGGDLKRVTLELGGNDAAILLDDIDIAATIPAVLARAFFNVGQTCAIPKRIFVPDSIYDEVVDAFVAEAAKITLGAGDEGTMGPLSTKPQYDKVCQLVKETIAAGHEPVIGGSPVDGPGLFFEPTIFRDVQEGMRLVDEEQFAPVLPLIRYKDVDEAIARANDTMYGLCGSIWASDLDRSTELARRLECGDAYINCHGVHMPNMPMIGAKWSGVGVEQGIEGMLEFAQKQVVYCPTRVIDTALVD